MELLMKTLKETIEAGAPWFITAGASGIAFCSLLLERCQG